jgi:nitrile hydratase accessory protein
MKDRDANPRIAEMEGMAGIPRQNGELVFHDEWERRAFAMAVALCERGRYSWDEFREELIAAIDQSPDEMGKPCPNEPGYFEHWLGALERVLREKRLAGLQSTIP